MSKYQEGQRTSIAVRIKYHMAEMDISQQKLADVCGCHRDLIYSYIHGKCKEENMDISILKCMAQFFKKPTYYFCNEYLKFLDTENVPERLRSLRRKLEMTQREFSERYEIPLASYKGYEAGKTRLQYEYWKRIFPI